MVLCALKSVDQNTKHTCMGWGGGTHGSLLIVIQNEGYSLGPSWLCRWAMVSG